MTEVTYPIEFSIKGNNTHYHHCEHIGGMKGYAICLHTIKAHEEGRRKPTDQCSPQIEKGICPALAMRKQEQEAGHTLFYTPRKELEVVAVKEHVYITPKHITQTESYQRGYSSAGAIIKGVKQPEPIKSKPTAKNKVLVADGSMAGVINEMMKAKPVAKRFDAIDKMLEKLVENLKTKTGGGIGGEYADEAKGETGFCLNSPALAGYTLFLFTVARHSGSTYPATINTPNLVIGVSSDADFSNGIKAIFALPSTKESIQKIMMEVKRKSTQENAK